MLAMIFVNDNLDVSGTLIPWLMKHYDGPSGMTYADVVFPAFLFMVGMSIPFALGGRLDRGESLLKTIGHVLGRTGSLLFLGILAVNGTPDSEKMGWSGSLWCTFVYLCALAAFCDFSPPRPLGADEERRNTRRKVAQVVRSVGWLGLIFLALAFRNKNGRPLLVLWPFYVHHIWYGILGYIGWAYLVSSILFLTCGKSLNRILACAVLLMCLYPASKTGMFDGWWIAQHVNIGVALGSRAFITAAGLFLGTLLRSSAPADTQRRVSFALLLTAGFVVAAILLNGLYGTSKERATPSWSLWGCAITTLLWLMFYFLADLRPPNLVVRALALAGGNVFLAYIFSEMLPFVLDTLGWHQWYDSIAHISLGVAVLRGIVCSLLILLVTTALNRVGFRLRL